MILLDMELPKKDGREVLTEIRGDESLLALPVLVLTASAVHRASCRRRTSASTVT